jgi:mRNA-degrading endonuclease RelE of RelBE toxin-antitoxin system
MLISDSPYRAIIQIDEEAKQVFILRILHTSRNI